MMNANMMFLRPGNLFKEFVIERNTQKVTNTGRVASKHSGTGMDSLKGCLADATADERSSHGTKNNTVTHTIVQPGKPKAKKTDRLILGNREFYIVDIDEAGSLGISTIYYAEERSDIR
ncbi:MAG: head-tail adaptor protein [Bariatricus sp.]